MGMSTGSGGSGGGHSGGRGRRGRRRAAVISEINVTPFVDVMLVLLIIFMVAAPLLTVGVPIDLPQTQGQSLNQETEPLAISVSADGTIYLQDTAVEIEEIVPRLIAITNEGYDERIYVRGDRTVSYGDIMRVMGRISGAGFRRVALVTEVEQDS